MSSLWCHAAHHQNLESNGAPNLQYLEENEHELLVGNELVTTHEPVTFGWTEIEPVYNSPPSGNLKINSFGEEFKVFPSIEEGFIT